MAKKYILVNEGPVASNSRFDNLIGPGRPPRWPKIDLSSSKTASAVSRSRRTLGDRGEAGRVDRGAIVAGDGSAVERSANIPIASLVNS